MSQLEHLLQDKPAPARENIEIIKKDREQVDRLYRQTAGHGRPSRIDTPSELRPVGFLQLMASSFNRSSSGCRRQRPQTPGQFRIWVWPLRGAARDASSPQPFSRREQTHPGSVGQATRRHRPDQYNVDH